ncbi:hypothetical protein GOP47_0011839 [Adiantum capillus-veneris]|uniref:VQ domain-containing protein n=1 Tax=Adiantum capillus-veneris TaxID=13818 RepID=A0A9D4ZI67_ADICA|nr:hypothetical protein GOP47_0011839 [Adiantum capillus-veneris]
MTSACEQRKKIARLADHHQSKTQLPIIRVIHIDSPVFVHTDVANFRATVQSLTSSPTLLKAAPAHAASQHPGGDPGLYIRCTPMAADPTNPHFSHHLSTNPQSNYATQPKGFNDGDILAGLISEEPLPDLSMLPPALHLQSIDECMNY